MKLQNNGRRWVCRRNHRTPPTVWYLAAVAYLGSSSSCINTGLATVACRGDSSYSNTGLAAVACLGSSSNCSNTGLAMVACHGNSSYSSTRVAAVACLGSSSSCSNTGFSTVACRGNRSTSNTGLAVVACRGSSSNISNGLAAVGLLISINVAPMFSLRPGRRDSSNRYSNLHGESLRSEVTGRTEVAIWRCQCSPCRRDRSSRRRRQWHLLQQHLRLKR